MDWTNDWTDENWQQVLSALCKNRGVVPIVGPDLLLVRDGDCEISFPCLLAKRLREELPAAQRERFDEHASLHELALAPVFGGRAPKFAEALRRIHDSAVVEAERQLFPEAEGQDPPPVAERHPLRLLAEITGFSLYISTTPDRLLERALARVRCLPDDHVRSFVLLREKPGTGQRGDWPWDLPARWEPSETEPPFLFHLFGRLSGQAQFDVTEEDHLEMLWRLQSESDQPEHLIREMRTSHVLFLGQPLADWHGRFFLRLFRGQRMSAHEEATTHALTDSCLNPGPSPPHYTPLVAFLKNFSESTRIFREGPPVTFVRALFERWKAKCDEEQAKKAAEIAPCVSSASTDLDNDGIFISYHKPDQAAAERLTADLRDAGFKVYFDKSSLGHGVEYLPKLMQNVEKATFFIPLLSQHTQELGHYYRREWEWAGFKNSEFYGADADERAYIRPVIVDASNIGSLKNIPPEIRKRSAIALPGGIATQSFLDELSRALKRWGKKSAS